MSDSIPMYLRTSFNDNQAWTASVIPYGGVFGNPSTGFGDHDMPVCEVWILERRSPSNPVVYTKRWTSPSELPEGLSSYLNDRYLLVFGFGGWITDAPSGQLYEALTQNGAGVQLRKLSSWSTALACGVSSPWAYSLISVPGSGLPGVELAAMSSTSKSRDNIWANELGPWVLSVELVEGADGNYSPVRFG